MTAVRVTKQRVSLLEGDVVRDYLPRGLVDDADVVALQRDPDTWPAALRNVIEGLTALAVEPLIHEWGEAWNQPIAGVRTMTYPVPHLYLEMMLSTVETRHLCGRYPGHPLPPVSLATDEKAPSVWHSHEELAEWQCRMNERTGILHRAYLIALQPVWHLRRRAMAAKGKTRAGILAEIAAADPLPSYRREAAKTLRDLRPADLATARAHAVELLERWATAEIHRLRGAVTPEYARVLPPVDGESTVTGKVTLTKSAIAEAVTSTAVYAALDAATKEPAVSSM